jgi:oxygen-independent coproporphyrinogen-3 oxidase
MCRFYIEIIKNRSDIEGYENYILKELSFYERCNYIGDYQLKSIYFGGGTASLLSPDAIFKIVKRCLAVFKQHTDLQITVESHPNVVDLKYLQAVYQRGVNRISFGIQSFNDDDLHILGLRQRADTNRSILEYARAIGFDTVAIDLIYRIPHQKEETFFENIQKAIDMGVTSFSLYSLELQERQSLLSDTQPSADEDRQLFYKSRDIMLRNGFEHLAQPDFNRSGHINQDVKVSWMAPQGQAIGLGAGAWSYFNDSVYCGIHNINRYKNALDATRFPVLTGQRMTQDDQMSRYMVLGARCLHIPIEPFTSYFGISPLDVFYRELQFLESKEMITVTPQVISLTDKGIYHVDNVSKEFYSYANRCRLQPFSCGIAADSEKGEL